MKFPTTYQKLGIKPVEMNDYRLVPIRYEDRWDIMKWRNEQIYHLRQQEPLTEKKQEDYYQNVVAKIFEEEKPKQILFSYLRNGKCIGYGGLVHINWVDKNAEISFIINTQLEGEEFKLHWGNYLQMLEKIAFGKLHLHKIYTYAFDLRPHLYEAVENVGFVKEAVLKEHCFFDGEFKDVVIHSKKKTDEYQLRLSNIGDMELIYNWANDKAVRANAFSEEEITWEEHKKWFENKLNSRNSKIYIFERDKLPLGQVRIDLLVDRVWRIDYSIDKNFRGKGLGYLMMKKLILINKELSFIAEVKNDNISSQKIFEKLGFSKKQESNYIVYNYG